MALYLDPVPSGQLTTAEGNGTPALIRWMNAVKAMFADVPQPATGDIWRAKRVAYGAAVPISTTVSQVGWDTSFITGTITSPTLTTTAMLTATPRLNCATSAVANNHAGGNSGSFIVWRGNAAGLGGFRFEIDCGVVTTQTTMRIAAGLAYNGGAAIPLTANPSAATDCVFLGCDDTDTNMQIMHNDNAGTCTKIDLGASFPKTNNVMYRALFECDANGSSIDYTVTRLDSAATATGTISTNLPTSTAFMAFICRVGNGGTAAIATGAFFRYLLELGTPT